MSPREFDAVVIGAGPAGMVAAGRLSDGGLDVALVEPELVGGECSYYACMPSKALLRPAELLAEVERVPGLPVSGRLDVQRILARRDEVIHDLDDSGQLPWLEERDITLFRAGAELAGERRVRAGDDELIARLAVIVATGSGSAMPPIDGLAKVGAWSSREITTAKTPPRSLLILGGGVVGIEMAQAWSSLGSEITVVEGAERILMREEEFAAEQVADALRGRGVEIRTSVEVTGARRNTGSDLVTLELEGGDAVEAQHLLVAVGRKPRVEGLGLDTAGLDTDGKAIEVDDRMRVGGRDWLYAIGDVNGRALLTHVGKHQARVAAENILGRETVAHHDDERSPRVIFTDPEIAAVGYTLTAARDAGLTVSAVDVDTAGTAGASFHGRNAPGTSRLVVDDERQVIVGATFVGPDVNELLHAATIAVTAEVPLDVLIDAVPAFPTRNEIWLNLLQKHGL
ncbi:MAG TPA: NAD(P)/FAD-dependent oxidoreductase [Solirubrobacterales bacterium]|nr:NAD(P)/FAD-dependent oxidoreductase [Solirubrobacterales bacterium]